MNLTFKTDPDIIFPYTFDSSNLKGFAEKLFIPENINELCEGIKSLNVADEQFTISGAGTGITGARVPNGGTVVSLEKFNSIELINSETVIVGAAVTLNELDVFLEQHNLFLPPNPTETNASIGGNTATNASGARTFKYGAIRNYITSLIVVLANGELIELRRGEIFADEYNLNVKTVTGKNYNVKIPEYLMPDVKNASGYFAKKNMEAIDLFIGSEGTLCVFAEIGLKVSCRPKNVLGGIVFFDDSSRLLDFVTLLRQKSFELNKIPTSENNQICSRLIEFFDNQSLLLLKNKYSEIPENSVGAVWFEQEYDVKFEEEIINEWYEFIEKYTGLADETWFAMNDKDHLKLKEFRHELPLQVYENLTNNSQKKVGLDCAVPVETFPQLYNFYLENFPKLGLEYVIFGHIGNCHLHANIFCKNETEYIAAREFYDKSIDLALSLNGTVSAEHGIGKLKKPYLVKMYGQHAIDEMIAVKKVFDEKLLLNMGTMFDV